MQDDPPVRPSLPGLGQQQIEGIDLTLAPNQLKGPSPRTGRIRIQSTFHIKNYKAVSSILDMRL
ncbi:hypothetical protein AAur_pTC20017 (plasmid) [Paenarthrobacter aurescens TC1]|uniref:Uncharacterized protein n=1 Tax=Paenarthrobacter aurescens (strain TC1) TaxID=290340 RepID=A1RD71_PAEAT|nr:hypothetical protein AAur_pTC20017 [Paenarthrobacter aurescens TC1]